MLLTFCIIFIAGTVFGLSMFLTQKVLFISKKPMLAGILSTLRLCILGRFFYIILKSTQIHPIILVALFLGAYWLTIFKFKELTDART